MAPVVWGLDLAEIHYSKFKSSYMWNNEYYLRRTKFIVYQCALIFCVISESLGTAVLSDYLDGQKRIQSLTNHQFHVSNNDYVGAGSFNIFAGVFVAFIFGAAFFFDLFWPERKESKGVMLAWKICGILAVIFHLAAALTLTIITATHRASVTPVIPPESEIYWWNKFPKHNQDPLVYRHNSRALAAVVFAWLGWCSVVPSCVLLFLSINHTQKGLGAKSKHARERDAAQDDGSELEGASSDFEKDPENPNPAVRQDAQVNGHASVATAAE